MGNFCPTRDIHRSLLLDSISDLLLVASWFVQFADISPKIKDTITSIINAVGLTQRPLTSLGSLNMLWSAKTISVHMLSQPVMYSDRPPPEKMFAPLKHFAQQYPI